MSETVLYDWDSAIVTVKVPTSFTASQTETEVQLNICQFANLVASHLHVEDGIVRPCKDIDFVLSHEIPDPS